MRLKLLSIVGLAGLTGLILNQVFVAEENVKIGKYSPRIDQQKAQQSKQEANLEFMHSLRANPKTGIIDPALVKKATEAAYASAGSRSSSNLGLEFEFMGPNNIGGRTRGIVVDVTDNQKVYAASVSGGVFISTNGGSTWSRSWKDKNGNDIRTNNVSCLTQSTNGHLYAGTGCTYESPAKGGGSGAPAGRGYGIFKSTDGGSTWEILPSTEIVQLSEVNSIKAHPTDPNTIAAGTSFGVMITTDGGETWTNEAACLGGSARANTVHSVEWSKSGKYLYVAFADGLLYAGAEYTQKCGLTNDISTMRIGEGARYTVAASTVDEETVYAMTPVPGRNPLIKLKVSKDAGLTWSDFSPVMPTSAQHYDLFSQNPVNYNQLFGCVPNPDTSSSTKDLLFVGAVQLWRYDGNWTMAAVGGRTGGPPNPYQVHVDHHVVVWDKKDPKNVYFGNDGGVYKSLDGGYTFFDMNKGYQSTQFYGIDIANYDYAVGGTQDNGNIFVTPFRPGNPDYGTNVTNQGVLNGDGFEAVVSDIVDLKFVSSQYGNMGRGNISSPQGSGACQPYCGMGDFHTWMKLWESENDLSSKDSITFKLDTIVENVGIGTGTRTTFQGTIEPFDPSAKIIPGSIRIGTVSDQLIYDGKGGFTGNGSGTLDETTLEFSVSFDFAPSVNARINAYYAFTIAAGSTITVESQTDKIPIKYLVQTNLVPGDVVKIQDPVQSIIGLQVNQRCNTQPGGGVVCDDPNYRINNRDQPGGNPNPNSWRDGLAIARKAIVLGQAPEWMHLYLDRVNTFEFSPKGNEIFFTPGSSSLRLVKGIDELYSQDDIDEIQDKTGNGRYPVTNIFSGSGTITSISFNPADENQLLITTGNYGAVNHVYLLNRTPGTDIFIPTNVTGNLPDMPVYDGVFDHVDQKKVVIGTDQGVWTTSDITASPVEWELEKEFPLLPVLDVDQQTIPYGKASNTGITYFGTHGGGIWKTGSLVGIDEITHKTFGTWESSITVYPNPLRTEANISVTVNNPTETLISIYNLSGTLVKTMQPLLEAGENDFKFNVSSLPAGNYLIQLKDGNDSKVAKFVKMN